MMTQTTETETARAVVPQRLVLALGGALTLLSMAWTAWSVVDLVGRAAPTPVAAAVAAGLELTWVALVALEWAQVHRTGRAPRGLAVAGWATAAVVVAVLALHGWLAHWSLIPLALMPLGAKALWHWALASMAEEVREQQAEARRQEEEEARRAAELDTGLTPEQQAELAELRRQAAYLRERAAAEAEVTQARAEAERLREEIDHQLRRETLRRAAELRMDTDRTTAEVLLQRVELERELRMSQPVLGLTAGTPAPAAEPGQELTGSRPPRRPDLGDPTVVDAAWRDITRRLDDDGEGGAEVAGPGLGDGGPTGAARRLASDLQVPRGASPSAFPEASSRPSPEAGQAQLLAYVAEHGAEASVRGAARLLGVDPRTIRRWRDALEERGHDLSVLHRTP